MVEEAVAPVTDEVLQFHKESSGEIVNSPSMSALIDS
jgi:hypothetical protein